MKTTTILLGASILAGLVLCALPRRSATGMNALMMAAKPIVDLPVTQAFRLHIGSVGNLNRSGVTKPFAVTMPVAAGAAITEVYSPTEWGNSSPSWTLGIRVNGLKVFDAQVGASTNRSGAQNVVHFAPPVIVPPGGLLEMGLVSQSQNATMIVGIGGYVLTKADLGQ